MALYWQLKNSRLYQIFKAVPLDSYIIFDLWSAVLQPQVIPYSGLQYFSKLSLNRHDFRRNIFFVTKCVLIFPTNFLWNIFYYKKSRAKINHNISASLHIKEPFFLSDLRETWIFLTCSEIFKYQVSWNSVHAYKRTDRHDEANICVSQFDAPKKEPFLSIFSQTQKVSIGSRKFRGNSSVSSRSKPGEWRTKE